jgi:hypothetical protein
MISVKQKTNSMLVSEELEELSNGKKKRGGANAIRAPHVKQVECRVSRGFQQIALYLVKAFL